MKYISYLDIETTGLSPYSSDLTVIGIHLEEDGHNEVIQLVGGEIQAHALIDLIKDRDIIYTYNGSRFDLPFIEAKLRIDIEEYCEHEDLMYACWQRNLYGGLKAVERKLGIERELSDMNGIEAIKLWYEYVYNGCIESLDKLLEYNKEDVINLKTLRRKLGE